MLKNKISNNERGSTQTKLKRLILAGKPEKLPKIKNVKIKKWNM